MTFWPLSDFFSTSWIWARGAPGEAQGPLELLAQEILGGDVQGVGHGHPQDTFPFLHRHEVVLEHQVDRDGLEERELHRLPGQVQVGVQLPGRPEVGKCWIAGLDGYPLALGDWEKS